MDSGVGIAPEHFRLIFDQFRQVDGSNTRKFGGTGLGLAICKNLVRMMGGKIWVESEVGKGALFNVELPVTSGITSSWESRRATKPPSETGQTDQMRVMVVDDEDDSLELFREILQRMGHEVLIADTGFEALRLLEQWPLPDLIFMDIQMPVLSGIDTLRLIRERYEDIPVIAQSAHALAGDRARFLSEGFDEYLSKPFTPEKLLEVITSIIRTD